MSTRNRRCFGNRATLRSGCRDGRSLRNGKSTRSASLLTTGNCNRTKPRHRCARSKRSGCYTTDPRIRLNGSRLKRTSRPTTPRLGYTRRKRGGCYTTDPRISLNRSRSKRTSRPTSRRNRCTRRRRGRCCTKTPSMNERHLSTGRRLPKGWPNLSGRRGRRGRRRRRLTLLNSLNRRLLRHRNLRSMNISNARFSWSTGSSKR